MAVGSIPTTGFLAAGPTGPSTARCRPVQCLHWPTGHGGHLDYELPIVEGYTIFTEANRLVSGLAKRARFVMSHATGKIEICGLDDRYIYMRYHRAHLPEDYGKMIIALRDEDAYWFDQLTVVSGPASAIEYAADYQPAARGY